jgi:hypothetical protein
LTIYRFFCQVALVAGELGHDHVGSGVIRVAGQVVDESPQRLGRRGEPLQQPMALVHKRLALLVGERAKEATARQVERRQLDARHADALVRAIWLPHVH